MDNLIKLLSIVSIITSLNVAASELKVNNASIGFGDTFSKVDGSHFKMTKLIKDSILYPTTFNHIETTVVSKGSRLLIKCTYSSELKDGSTQVQSVSMTASMEGKLTLFGS